MATLLTSPHPDHRCRRQHPNCDRGACCSSCLSRHRICPTACTRLLAFALLLRIPLVPSCNTVPTSDRYMPVLLHLSIPLSFVPPAASFSRQHLLPCQVSSLGSVCQGMRLVLLRVIVLYESRALPRRALISVAFLTVCSCVSSSCLSPSPSIQLLSVSASVPLVDSLPRPLLSSLTMAFLLLCGPCSRALLFLLCVYLSLLLPRLIASCIASYFLFATP